ncbi:hypothetical protein DBR17_19750 [Sphingomonas sp. HMWF008]|nr:hypothetical protein DBR17_19750 [Sphingomonas sp. HMWF008]
MSRLGLVRILSTTVSLIARPSLAAAQKGPSADADRDTAIASDDQTDMVVTARRRAENTRREAADLQP